MIIFLQPMYSKAELNADSNYVSYAALIRQMHRSHPDWHFSVVFPDAKSGFKYEPDGLFDLPNVTRIAQRINTRKFGNAVSYDSRWYDRLFKSYGFEAVWCRLVEIAGAIRNAGEGTEDRSGQPAMVAHHDYTIHPSLPYSFDRMAHVAWLQVGGAVISDVNIVQTEYSGEMLLETAATWLHAEALAKLRASLALLPSGALPAEMPAPTRPHNEQPIIAYNHRLQSYKGWRDTFAAFEQLYSEGYRFTVRYFSNTSEKLALIQELPFVEVHLSSTHAEYMRKLAECDINVTNSKYETYCLSGIESMAFDQLLIAPARATFPEITDAARNGYPYLFSGQNDQLEIMRTVLDDHRTARDVWGKMLGEHVRSHHNAAIWAERFADVMRQTQPERMPNVKPDALEMIREKLLALAPIHLFDLSAEVRGVRVNGRTPFGTQSMTPTKLLRICRQLGARIEQRAGKQMVHLA